MKSSPARLRGSTHIVAVTGLVAALLAAAALTAGGAAAITPPAHAASPRIHRCGSIEGGFIYKIRITNYSCAYAYTLLYSFISLRRGHWWWTASNGHPGFLRGYWNANPIPGEPTAWTCRAAVPFRKVRAVEAGPGAVSCALRHPAGKITAMASD